MHVQSLWIMPMNRGLRILKEKLVPFQPFQPEFARMVTDRMHEKSPQQGRSIPQRATTSSVEDLGNPFSGDLLLALETKDIMPAKVVASIQNIKKIGQSQYKKVSMACCSFDDLRLFVSNFDG